MERFKIIVALVIVFFQMHSVGIKTKVYAQNTISKKEIPANITRKLRQEIERLYSGPHGKYSAMESLGAMGAQAAPAAPFLIELLGDETTISLGGCTGTSIGIEAAAALAKIGSGAVELLLSALKNKNSMVRRNAIMALKKIKDDRAIEPLITMLKDNAEGVR